MNETIRYMNKKKIPFVIKTVNGTKSLMPVKVTKTGIFWRANGKIISRKYVRDIIALSGMRAM